MKEKRESLMERKMKNKLFRGEYGILEDKR